MTDDLAWMPATLRLALGAQPATSDLDGELCVRSATAPVFHIVRAKGQPISGQEAEFILEVLRHRDRYIEAALRFIGQGVSAPSGNASIEADPCLIFRGQREFDIHFQTCRLPNHASGVLVAFNAQEPVSMTAIDDPAAWWDDESSAWVAA